MEKSIMVSDESLAADLNNCPENLAILINRYQAPLSRYIFRLSGLSKEDIEDILQLVFLKLYLNINNFDPELKLSTWLYRIAHNETISHHRRRLARPNVDYSIDNEALNSLAGHNWQQTANIAIWRTQLNQAINNLPNKYREIIILRYFEDLDYQAIADIIQQPIGTVATLLSRGKQRLQNLLIKKHE
ncbi:MAG TPA: RNA polymerase sigma factor [bacterium]|nr:RNA polymerase sigma factor [bacterium]